MLEIRGVHRSFGDRVVLEDVSFSVRTGKMTGFVGSNGAGKTTTMRIILGVLEPSSGEVLSGGRPVTQAERARFGYMPEERGLYPKTKVQDQLIYLARLHGVSHTRAKESTEELLAQLGLTERAGDSVESLSLGNQQRVQIAAALVHDPEVLVLDEPFSGLDPYAIEVVLGVLRERAARGVPVLFSSHQLDVVERLCDDVVVIGGGKILAQGTREGLRDEYATPTYELSMAGTTADAGWVSNMEGVSVEHLDGAEARFTVLGPGDEQRILQEALNRGRVERFAPVRPTLAEIFTEVTQ